MIGDSFVADWSVKYTDYEGWPNLLAKTYDVTNVAQAGVGEYKIYKQLQKVNLDNFDIVIISHTSPYRVHTREHPIHSLDVLHKDCDLMLGDISYHASRIENYFNKSLHTAKSYFEYHFDPEYYETTFNLYKKCIDNALNNKTVITFITFADQEKDSNSLDVIDLLSTHRGKINHFTQEGNRIIYEKIVKILEKV